jgi:folylpolyglutamate synthase/dihydropteroate synthase
MVTDPVDEPFFREWLHGRARGAKRSKVRAQAFLEALLGSRYDDLMRTPVPLVVAVGSKGKGTTAAYSSAALAAAGLRVGTVTSPGFRSHRERIRVDGQSITPTEFAMLAMAIEETRERQGSDLPNDGYLSPTGLFTMAGVLYFIDSACDAWVFEAGMGGRSDEVSLLSPDVVAVTPIFEEHVGILGRDVREIAVDKLGVVTERTSHGVTQSGQHPVAMEVLSAVAKKRAQVLDVERLPALVWPPGLGAQNGQLGYAAGMGLLSDVGVAEPHSRTTAELFRSIQLPGRLSVHHGRGRTWVLDCAINRVGVEAAVQWTSAQYGRPDNVLISLPDDKSTVGVDSALRDLRVTKVRARASHLSYQGWAAGSPHLDVVLREDLGPVVLAIGTVSFIAEVLNLLEAPVDRWWAPTATVEPASGHRPG